MSDYPPSQCHEHLHVQNSITRHWQQHTSCCLVKVNVSTHLKLSMPQERNVLTGPGVARMDKGQAWRLAFYPWIKVSWGVIDPWCTRFMGLTFRGQGGGQIGFQCSTFGQPKEYKLSRLPHMLDLVLMHNRKKHSGVRTHECQGGETFARWRYTSVDAASPFHQSKVEQ